MNNKPEVSIIMPVYNVEKYVAESLDSVLNQTFKDFELICVNDGSVDNCWDIVKEYAASDKRIKLFDNGKNLGQSVSRNFGLEVAKGNYIMFMDSDDFIHQQTLEIALYFIKKYDGDIVNWRIKHLWKKDDNIDNSLYEDFNKIDMKVSLNPILMFESGVMNSSCNKLFNRDIVGNTRFIEGVKFEDNAFVLELLYKKPKMVILDSQLYNYVCYNSGSSMRMRFSEKTFSDYNAVFRRIYDVWKNAPKSETKFIKDHLFRESKNYLRAIRRNGYPENIKRAFANWIKDMNSVGWLRIPKDLRKIDKIKHLIRLKYYIYKYADKGEQKNV